MPYKDPEVRRRYARERYHKKKKDSAWHDNHKRHARNSAKKKRAEGDEQYLQANKERSKEWRRKNPDKVKQDARSWYLRKAADPAWLEANRIRQNSLYTGLSPEQKCERSKKNNEYRRERQQTDPAWHEEQKRKAKESRAKKMADPEYRARVNTRNRKRGQRLRQDPAYRAERSAAACKRQREQRDWLDSIKGERGCQYCTTTEPLYLDFHHRDPKEKEFTIGSHTTRSRARLLKEIAKCDVVCAYCHRKITHGRSHSPIPVAHPQD